ncbi:hypothetical protein ACF3MZ_05265 [Paenibacillaceae bacterium WGS1546]
MRELTVADPGKALRLVRGIESVFREDAANSFFKASRLHRAQFGA